MVGRAHKQRGKGTGLERGKGKKEAPADSASPVQQIVGVEEGLQGL